MMKKAIRWHVATLMLLGMIVAGSMARSSAAEIGNTITINPFGFIGWGPDIEYEGVLSPSSAIALRAKVGGWSLGDWKTNTFGGGVSYRFFLQEENPAPRGLWIGPSVDLLSVTSQYQSETAVSGMFYSIYGQLGYKWLFGKKVAFALSPYLNLGYSMGSLSSGSNKLDVTGAMFGIGLAMGVAF